MNTTVLVIGLAPIVGALFCVTVAGIKNRDLASWFLLGLATSVLGAIAVCCLPTLDMFGERRRTRTSTPRRNRR
jgi:hypothetical protein